METVEAELDLMLVVPVVLSVVVVDVVVVVIDTSAVVGPLMIGIEHPLQHLLFWGMQMK